MRFQALSLVVGNDLLYVTLKHGFGEFVLLLGLLFILLGLGRVCLLLALGQGIWIEVWIDADFLGWVACGFAPDLTVLFDLWSVIID